MIKARMGTEKRSLMEKSAGCLEGLTFMECGNWQITFSRR